MKKSTAFILGALLMVLLAFVQSKLPISEDLEMVKLYDIKAGDETVTRCAVVVGYPGGGIDCKWD